ncbi:MAG: hypothetical protein LBK53_08430 [Heliobacteriaceae bacterium]|jgi:hypothetical protein|nr:hypothetical protein [Heliobacteriaceae bacterium]
MKKKIEILFSNLCCSQCKSGFDENSIDIKREEAGLTVTHLECRRCGKKFGIAFIGFSGLEVKEPLEVQEGPEPINYDDVIDAHRFIRELDEHWQEHLPKNIF